MPAHTAPAQPAGPQSVRSPGVQAPFPSHSAADTAAPSRHAGGAHIVFEKITVTGTENILMAATMADGETRLDNAAREPEVTDLVNLLVKMGARIEGAGTSCLRIHGV